MLLHVGMSNSSLLATQGKKIEKSKQTRLFNKVCTDTRLLAAGDIFLALRGDNFDGHLFIEKAIEKGAAAIIGEQFPSRWARLYLRCFASRLMIAELLLLI